MRRLLPTYAAALLLAGIFPAVSAAEPTAPKWDPWFEVGGYLSNERSRGEGALFVPLMQSAHALLFADVRGKLFEEDQQEGNFAVGFRQMLQDGWNVGVWTGYDLRTSTLGSTFGQVSLGVEALHPLYDIRVNAYLPTEMSQIVASGPAAPTTQLVGSNLLLYSGGTVTTRELAFRGIDGEVGVKLPVTVPGADPDKYELRAYAGAFAFDNDSFDRTLIGPKTRLEWRINDVVPQWSGSRLTFEAEYQWDEVRDDQIEAGLRLRLPFGDNAATRGHAPLSAQERRMTEGLERDTDVVNKPSTSTTAPTNVENVADAKTGANFDRVVVVEGGNDLQTAVNSGGSNSLVIAKGGTDYALSGQLTLATNQTLQGGGSTIMIRGLQTGLIIPFTAPGSRPTVTDCGCDVVSMRDATHLSGLNLRSLDVDVRNGTHVVALDNLTMTNNFIAIAIHSNASDVMIDNVHISNATGGIGMTDNNTVSMTNVTISGAAFGGIGMGYNNVVTMDNVRLDNAATGAAAMSVQGTNTISMSNSAINGSTYTSGIEFLDTGNVLSGTGNANGVSSAPLCGGLTASQSGSFGFSGTPASCP